MGRVEGKVALITGAARGQGRAHALRFAEEGADIVLCDACASVDAAGYAMPSLEDLEQTADMVRAAGRRALARQVDVRDGAGMAELAAAARDELGRMDVVVANAGIASYGALDQLSEDTWREVIDINLTGVWHTVRSAAPAMIEGGRGGSVVLISSVAGDLGLMNMTHYVSAKHGVVGLAKALANELGGHGIRVNAVLPGTVNTDMAINDATFKLFRPDLESPGLADVEDVMRGLTLLPTRWVEPEDVSNAVLWLSSDEARFVTGVALPVDAGYMVKSF